MDKVDLKYRLIKAMQSFNKIRHINQNFNIPDFSGKYNSIPPSIVTEYNKFRPSGPGSCCVTFLSTI